MITTFGPDHEDPLSIRCSRLVSPSNLPSYLKLVEVPIIIYALDKSCHFR